MEIFVVCRVNEEAKEESRRKFVKFSFLPIMDQNVHDQREPYLVLVMSCLFGNRFADISLSFSCVLI